MSHKSGWHLRELQVALQSSNGENWMPPILPEHKAILDVGCGMGQTLIGARLPADVLGDGVRRYGFHGLSCESILAQLDPVPSRLVIAHLGGGASVTAVGAGQSVDTSMGLTPNGGVIMETRSGDLDPGLLIYLLRQGQTADTLEQLLNHRSGMAGVGGNGGDPRKLAGGSGKLALEMFALSIAKAIACMAIVLEGIDLVAFTGGIGEHDADIRQSVLDRLDWIGTVPARVIPAREEMVIVRHCLTLTHG